MAVVGDGTATEEEIDAVLAVAGSKWNSEGKVDCPECVVVFCERLIKRRMRSGSSPLLWYRRMEDGDGGNEFCLSIHRLSVEDKRVLGISKEESVGTQGIVRITSDLRSRVTKGEIGRRPETNVVRAEPSPTDNVVILLARRPDGGVQVWNAFPGRITPRSPHPNQISEEQDYGRNFWRRYAIVR